MGCTSGVLAPTVHQAPWHWAPLEFRLEDLGFETPPGSDASQLPLGVEPGRPGSEHVQAFLWGPHPYDWPWLCGLGACEPPVGWWAGGKL